MAQNYSYPSTAVTFPSGGATAANQVLEIAQLTSINGKLTAPVAVTGPLTDTQLRATAVPVSASALPLPTGAATAANQVTANTALARLSGSLVPTAYDEIALTYVSSGAGIGQIATAVYKLATVTVKTLTLSYDGSDRLNGVVAS